MEVITVAGQGLFKNASSKAIFNRPKAVAVDAQGIIYVSDWGNDCIRRISTEGEITTLVKISGPRGIAVDREGNLIVVSPHYIHKVNQDGLLTILAGSGQAGFKDGKGASAKFDSSTAVAVDRLGNVIVADCGNHAIRKVTPEGEVSTLAAGGWLSKFRYPKGVAVDHESNIIVAYDNHYIVKITAEATVSILAGGEKGILDGQGLEACFHSPSYLVVDSQGNVYVADKNLIRKVTPQGMVSTVAGGTRGYKDGLALTACFNQPRGLALDRDQNLLITDSGNNCIRMLVLHGNAEATKFLRGPANSPFSGGLFALCFSQPAPSAIAACRVKFVVPIFHCNVDAESGEIGLSEPWAADAPWADVSADVSKLLECPDVIAPRAIKNKEAFALWNYNRREYNIRAQREAAESWARFPVNSTHLSTALEVLLPPQTGMDRQVQHQIFSELALVEAEKHLEQLKAQRHLARLADPEHKFNADAMDKHAVGVNILVEEDLDVAQAKKLQEKLRVQLLRGSLAIENPSHGKKMEWLEQRLVEFYLQELVPTSTNFSSAPSYIDKIPKSRAECFGLMVTEAEREQARLTELNQACLKKYHLMFSRFEALTSVCFEEEKQELVQPVVSTVEYFIAQAKLLEPSFRRVLQNMVDMFNLEQLPLVLVTKYGKSVFTQLRMMSGLHANVIFGPPKSAERVRQKGHAHHNCDYLRATVMTADPLLLALFYKSLLLSSVAEFKVRQVRNKHNLATVNQPPNLHVNFEFGGQVCEVQFILEDFLMIKRISHKSYEVQRIGKLQGSELEEAISRMVVAGVYVVHPSN